jgi:hypothetical protein
VILCSIFRDSTDYLDRYVNQVKALREHMNVSVVVAEGDSTDDTYLWLIETDFRVLKVEHGGPKFPSVDNPLRWRQLAVVCNVALTAAVRELGHDEPLVYVESDLIWSPETMVRLVKHLTTYPAVAPMSMHGDRFYDIWGHTKHWEDFKAYPPHFTGWSPSMMHQITSAGSCIAMSNTAAQVAHFSPVDCIRGVGRSIADAGLSLWLDPTLSVEHP